MGCHIRVDLVTGVPDYYNYLKSPSWMARRGLRTVGEDGKAIYPTRYPRVFPKNVPTVHLKMKPGDIPRHPNHQDSTAYFSFEERAVLDILEGQLAFLSAVRDYEKKHAGCRLLQPHLTWKLEFLACFIGALDEKSLDALHEDIRQVSERRHDHGGWAVRSSKDLSRILRHEISTRLGDHCEASLEELQRLPRERIKPFEWEPRKFFAFVCANSKGRFNVWVAPKALVFGRFLDWDFEIGISAIQGHSRLPDQVSETVLGERLTIDRCQQLGMIFHASDNSNYESIKEKGLMLGYSRARGRSSRVAIHFVYAGGVESPGLGTHIKYGSYIFYAKLDYDHFLQHGHELYLTDNGVVLSYKDVAPMYLTFHYRPPHEKDPGGLRHEKRQNTAGVSSSQEEETSASAAAQGSSPQGEAPGSSSDTRARPAPKKRPKTATAAESSVEKGSSPQGEVPTLSPEALQKLIREHELKEEEMRKGTETEGSTKYAYESGDTVHGKVDAHRLQKEEELSEVLLKARHNPWHLFNHGVLHLTDKEGNKMCSTYGDPYVKLTPWHVLSQEKRDLLGEEYNWATWLQHPLSGYSIHFFYKAFEFGKLTGNYLVEMRDKPKVYAGGYRSPFEDHPGGIPELLNRLQAASEDEFRPLVSQIGFPRPAEDEVRRRKPKPEDPGYAGKLEAHQAFLREWEVYCEIQHIREDFSMLISVVTEAYGPDFFAYIKRNMHNTEVRRKYMVKTVEGYGLYDSTLQQPFEGPYILACLEKVFMSNAEQKDFKSKFARKAKKDLMAYLSLKEKQETVLEELYTRPYEDIATEEFLDNLPIPVVEEVVEPEPMDTSDVAAGSANLPHGKTAGSAKTEPTDVPMETEAPESSPQGEASGVKVEPTEGSPQGEDTVAKDEHMGDNDEPMAQESSSSEEASMPDISPDKDTEDGPVLHDQGIWGKCANVVDPEAFKRAAAEAETQNESAFNNMENAKEKYGLEDTEEYQFFLSTTSRIERTSPMRMFGDQVEGYSYTGLYHTGIRDESYEPVLAFKVQHMNWRARMEPHPAQKFSLSEKNLFRQFCRMTPIYQRRPERLDVIFRTGDVRSTLDDRLMEKASAIQASTLEAYDALLDRAKELSDEGRPASREELLNAMLHYFLATGVDEEDIGDLSLDKIPNPSFFRFGLAEDGPVPVFTSKTKYTALILNLGNLARGRRKSTPAAFADYIYTDDTADTMGSLVKSIAHSKSHLFMLCEAESVSS